MNKRLLTAFAMGSLGLAACAPAADESMSEASDFVPPRDTDVLIAELTFNSQGVPSVGTPTNLTQRRDYDNQPQFVPDGSGFWYTINDPQNDQADIWRYDFATAGVTRVTMSSPESEYSATPLPDGSGISVIRVEADSTQRLWRFDPDGANGAVILPNVAPVGYHAWVDESTLVLFVLGDPATLQRADMHTGLTEVITQNIGRSIQRIPDSDDVSYAQVHEDGTATIMRLPSERTSPEPIVEAVSGGDFHAWAPNGSLLMASGSVVYAWSLSLDQWVPIADFSDLNISISRLAISPDGTQIVMVAEIAAIPGFPSS